HHSQPPEYYTLSLHDALPISTVWGGSERPWLYQDLMWTGSTGEPFMEDEEGNILHEAQSPVLMERVNQVHKYMAEGLMTQEYYTDRKSTRLNSSHVSISYAVF